MDSTLAMDTMTVSPITPLLQAASGSVQVPCLAGMDCHLPGFRKAESKTGVLSQLDSGHAPLAKVLEKPLLIASQWGTQDTSGFLTNVGNDDHMIRWWLPGFLSAKLPFSFVIGFVGTYVKAMTKYNE